LACRWRIRHKLMIGLALVIGILGLLLAGTLKGLLAYSATTSSIDSKLVELSFAQTFKAKVRDLTDELDKDDKVGDLRRKAKLARASLGEYEGRLNDTLQKRRDPEKGFREIGLLEDLARYFAELESAIVRYDQPSSSSAKRPDVNKDPEVEAVLTNLLRASDQLQQEIYLDLFNRTTEAKRTYRFTLALVVAITVLGVLLMTSLLRFFYRWTFYPVRDLQEGVSRVASGDFDHRIQVHSSDEMQELADAFNDMTGRLRDMYRDLARQVNERSRQLVRSERLAGVGFLAAGVAHEINNPLASIAFCSEALEARLTDLLGAVPKPKASKPGTSLELHRPEPETDREVIHKYLKMIQEEAFRCKEITQRLLEFSRGGERTREPTDLAEVVQSVLDIVHHIPSYKGKTIHFPGGKLVAKVNAQEIKSVVLNLVVNALDSMDEGGQLTIGLKERDGNAVLTFADTGCGMPADVLENIFEPFFTRSRTGKGTGLGLSISHRVVSQHGGEIEASSEGPGQGSTFTVRVPLQPVVESHPELSLAA